MHRNPMKLHLYRYGEARSLPGLSIGVTRHLPRGVRRQDLATRGYFDVWLPVLAPSSELVKTYLQGDISFAAFSRRYRVEMKATEIRHVIDLVAATALRLPVHLGCFCEDENACHRSILRGIVLKAAQNLPPSAPETSAKGYASPPCSMPEIGE